MDIEETKHKCHKLTETLNEIFDKCNWHKDRFKLGNNETYELRFDGKSCIKIDNNVLSIFNADGTPIFFYKPTHEQEILEFNKLFSRIRDKYPDTFDSDLNAIISQLNQLK